MNLSTAFAQAAEKDLRKTALFWGEREYSFEELLSQTRKVAGYLQNGLGLRPGDRVGLWLKNCPEFIPALFGILQAGGVVVPINNFLKPPEVSYILADAGADLIITDATLAEGIKFERPGLPEPIAAVWGLGRLEPWGRWSVGGGPGPKRAGSRSRRSASCGSSTTREPQRPTKSQKHSA